MENIYKALEEDHKTQRELARKLVETEGKSETRQSIYNELKTELEAHAAAEEKYFYRPLMKYDKTLEHARHSVAEHKELDDILEKLEDTKMDSSSWLKTAKHLKERLIHHVDEEEADVFPVAKKTIPKGDAQKLSEEFWDEKNKRAS